MMYVVERYIEGINGPKYLIENIQLNFLEDMIHVYQSLGSGD